MVQDVEAQARYRELRGLPRFLERSFLISMTVLGILYALQVHSYLGKTLFHQQYLGLFLAFALGAIFLRSPAGLRAPRDRAPLYDFVLILLSQVVGFYVFLWYPRISEELGYATWDKWVLGTLALILVVEATRRLTGWVLVLLVGILVFYGRFSELFPGALYNVGSSWERLATYLYLDANGLLGTPLLIGATVVMVFILFGESLSSTGASRFLTDFALATMGRYRGGPAKVSIVSSSLFGTVSGSAVANVVADGIITIPMMKGAGFPAHVAGAIEAVASTGGQIMPPVMGAAAFIMADFLGIPYGQVALAALLPAVLYYFSLFAQVDLEAAKHDLRGLSSSQLPSLRKTILRGWVFFVPLFVLVYTLFVLNWDASRSGMVTVAIVLALSLFRPEGRACLKRFDRMLENTGRALLEITVLTAAAGIVIGVITVSGLGFTISYALTGVAGGSLFLLALLTAIVSLILGMGMPTTAVYLLLAVLVAPAFTNLQVPLIAAHLFIFYFGMLSMVTPPVCFATYAAASIARAPFMKTGYAAMRFAAVAYVVPFFFLFHPALLLRGNWVEVALAGLSSIVGSVALAIGLVGFLFRPLSAMRRILFLAASLTLLDPGMATDILGVLILLLLVAPELRWRRQRKQFPLAAEVEVGS